MLWVTFALAITGGTESWAGGSYKGTTYKDAVPSHNLYLRLEGGGSWATDANIRDRATAPIVNTTTPGIIIFGDILGTVPGELNDIGEGYLVRGAVGKHFTDRLRGELSLGYRAGFDVNDLDAAPSVFEGDIDVFTAMASVFFDLTGNDRRITPYVGAGIGVAHVDADSLINFEAPGFPAFRNSQPGGDSTNFAWHVTAGATIKLKDRVSLDVGYRYFDAGDIEYDAGPITGISPGTGTIGQTAGAKGELSSHEAFAAIIIGLN